MTNVININNDLNNVSVNEANEHNQHNERNERNERKLNEDLHKYSLLSKNSIQLIAEQIGFDNVSESAILLLTEDISYRLRQLAYNSLQFMRHSKKTRLTCEHVNRSLQWSDCDHIFGYASDNHPINHIYVKESNVYVCDDNVINLNNEINNMLKQTVCDIKLYENNNDMSVEWVCGDQSCDTEINGNQCSLQLINYYQLITKAILGKDDRFLSIALKDLSNNSRLKPILSYIINFLSIGIKRLSHDINQLKRLLRAIEALFNNRSLYMATDSYLNALIESVLFCIIEPFGASINPVNDHWVIRDSASHLLSRIFEEWCTPLTNSNLRSKTISALKQTLLEFSKPFCSHYGVIVAFISFGCDSIIEHLYPCLSQYLPHLLSAINKYKYLDQHIYLDAYKVYSSLLIVAQIILNKFNSNIFNEIKCNNFFEIYIDLENIFGDSLTSMLYSNLEMIRVHYFSQNINNLKDKHLFTTPELLQTGEQLLDAFYETGQHMEEINSNQSICLDDDNSYDDNSLMSDTEKEAITTDGNIQIKSTISDPSLGIKLTIKKLRKDQQIDIMEKEVTKTNIFQKRSEFEPIFDYYTIKQNKHIIFNIRGATNRAVYKSTIYRNNVNTSLTSSSNLFNHSHWNQIFISKAYSSKRSKKRTKDMLYSCNLFMTL